MKKFHLLLLVFLLSACAPAEITQVPVVSPKAATTEAPTPLPPTPQPTITLTPSPTPLPRFFTEQFDGSLPTWSILQSNVSSSPATHIRDGSLVFELSLPYQWVYAIIGAEEYAEARLDVLVQSRGTSPDALGLICRYSEANGWYEFNVSNDGTYSVLFGQWLSQGVAQYSPIASDQNEYLNPGGQGNEIGLGCQEDTLWLYTNGKLFRKLDVARFGLQQGRLGLAVSSFENTPVSASFDWLKVSEP